MPWWAWLAVGVGLLVFEVMIQTEFWLAMLGAAAIGVGVLGLVGVSGSWALPVWGQWIAFAILTVFFTGVVRRKLHEKFVGTAPGLKPELEGDMGTVRVPMAPGAVGEVELRGTQWKARNTGNTPLQAGDRVTVEHVDGLQLDVRA